MTDNEVEELLRYAAESGQLDVDLADSDIDTVLKNAPEVELSPEVQARMAQRLRDALTCPICGKLKVHYRLYGYRCSNPEHAERERELTARQLRKSRPHR